MSLTGDVDEPCISHISLMSCVINILITGTGLDSCSFRSGGSSSGGAKAWRCAGGVKCFMCSPCKSSHFESVATRGIARDELFHCCLCEKGEI